MKLQEEDEEFEKIMGNMKSKAAKRKVCEQYLLAFLPSLARQGWKTKGCGEYCMTRILQHILTIEKKKDDETKDRRDEPKPKPTETKERLERELKGRDSPKSEARTKKPVVHSATDSDSCGDDSGEEARSKKKKKKVRRLSQYFLTN